MSIKIFHEILDAKNQAYYAFLSYHTIYCKTIEIMEYKRKQRAISDITKQKISMRLKGRKKSVTHCNNISKGLENYWKQIPQSTSGSTNSLV